VRDTLSLLDQLIAGSEGTTVEYGRAVALLGYTHGALLDEVVDALGARDAGGVFAAVDRVIQTGQDPRRFVEDLLERLRDLIVVAATRDGAGAVLRGVPQDELDRMLTQAIAFGAAELSRAADVVNSALTEMTGATSPRLHLELMVARLLVPSSDDTERGALARVERLERRVGIDALASASPPLAEPATASAPAAPPQPAAEPRVEANAPEKRAPVAPVVEPVAPVSLQQLRDAWPEILEVVQNAKRAAWMVVFTSTARALDGDVLTLTFPSEKDVASFRQGPAAGDSVSEHLRAAIQQVLGIRVKFIARVDTEAAAPEPAAAVGGWAVTAIPTSAEPEATSTAKPARAKAAPKAAEKAEQPAESPAPDPTPEPATQNEPATESEPAATSQLAAKSEPPAGAPAPEATNARYGEAVVREMLGASFIEEISLSPRDRAVPLDPER
jgi:DNA polymerase-3 subunit gamma/tau